MARGKKVGKHRKAKLSLKGGAMHSLKHKGGKKGGKKRGGKRGRRK